MAKIDSNTQIADAFNNDASISINNTIVKNGMMWVHGNLIARKDRYSMVICDGGFKTQVTQKRLNGIDAVDLKRVDGEWLLNGIAWTGEPVCVNRANGTWYYTKNEI